MAHADHIENRPTGPQPRTSTVSPPLEVAHLRRLITRGERVGDRQRVQLLDVFGDPLRVDADEGHADVLRLPAVVAAHGVRVAVDGGARIGGGVGALAAPGEPAAAEVAAAAEDLERQHHPLAGPYALHAGPDLLHDPGELVAEGEADAGVGDEAV
jgi:hypothetical protein